MINYEADMLFSLIFGCSAKIQSTGLYYSISFRSPIRCVFYLLISVSSSSVCSQQALGIGSERYETCIDMYSCKAKIKCVIFSVSIESKKISLIYMYSLGKINVKTKSHTLVYKKLYVLACMLSNNINVKNLGKIPQRLSKCCLFSKCSIAYVM